MPPPRSPRAPLPPRADADPSTFPAHSPWAAPQSHIPPPAPPSSRQPSPRRAETYLRRVTQPDRFDGPRPSVFQRGSQLLAGGLSILAVGWLVLWQDYGSGEHCFSPIRRLVGTRSIPLFTQELTPDQEHLRRNKSAAPPSHNHLPSSSSSADASYSSVSGPFSSSTSSSGSSSRAGSTGEVGSLIRGANELRQGKARVSSSLRPPPPTAASAAAPRAEEAVEGSEGAISGGPRERVEEAGRWAAQKGQALFGAGAAGETEAAGRGEQTGRIWARGAEGHGGLLHRGGEVGGAAQEQAQR